MLVHEMKRAILALFVTPIVVESLTRAAEHAKAEFNWFGSQFWTNFQNHFWADLWVKLVIDSLNNSQNIIINTKQKYQEFKVKYC